eukprot:2843894-Prymnesium_polylepis.1
MPLAIPLPHMDVVVLDQNLDLDGKAHLLGTDIARELHDRAFRGVTCIQAGASAQVAIFESVTSVRADSASRRGGGSQVMDEIAAMPGVDREGKGRDLQEMADRIRALLKARAHETDD